MKVYHGSKKKYDTLKLGGGNNELGSGIYFIKDMKTAKGYGSNVHSLDTNDFNIVKFESKITSKLVDELIKQSTDEYWWTNWSESFEDGKLLFKDSLTGIFGEDIQTLWYELYSDNETNFCKIVSKYVDCMIVNQEHGWKNMYVMYNIPKVNKLMKEVIVKESNFNNRYNTYMTEAKASMQDSNIKKYELDPSTVKNSCGKSTKDGKWYGWSHRAITGFGIGDKLFDQTYIKKGANTDTMKFQDRGSKTIKTDEEAKQAALNFSDYVS